MKRRDFIQKAGLSAGAMMLPFTGFGREVDIAELLTPIFDVQQKKQLADVALNTAKSLGASYADVRIGRYLNQFVTTRERRVQGVANTESFGVGVRVIANGTWGFGATNVVTTEGIKKATEKAVAIAKANSKFQKEPVKLAANPAYGEVSWRTPIVKNAFEVPVKDKVDLLLAANAKAMEKGASFVNSQMFLINEQKYFASTEGSYIDQDVFRIQPGFNVSMVDRQSGSFKSRSAFSAPVGMGYEYLDGKAEDKIKGPGGIILYNKSYDIIEDATMAAEQAKEMIAAKSVEAGKYDLVLEPSHMWLTIHESVGHPTELDRVLGYEANYAGTSFLTFDKWQSKKFKFGSDIVNFVADKTQVGSLGNVGYDDEGVKCKKWDLIKDGVLVNYQAIRDQVNILGQKESHGCCYHKAGAMYSFNACQTYRCSPASNNLHPSK
jgi:TldD protein